MEKVVSLIAQSAFELWKSRDFRELVSFEDISQTEQDRIFNELEVSSLGLFILQYDHLEKQITKEFIGLFASLGIGSQLLEQWEKLIEMRLEEYRDHYQLAIDETENTRELQERELRIIWSRVETISIDCLSHVRVGKVKKGDHLWKMLREFFVAQDIMFKKIMEKVKINQSILES